MTLRSTVGRAIVLLPAALAGTQAIAQESAPQPEGIEEVLVTATRRVETEQKVPVSLTALSGDQLDELGVSQTRSLVAFAPNLAQQGSFGRTAPAFFIRGIGSTQFNPNANSKVGVYVDDVYLSSPAVHGAQLFDVERIEVARGPQGYLFGQNTTGGLIRAITRKPVVGEGFTGEGEISLGRYDERMVDAALGGGIGSTAAWRVAANLTERAGISHNSFLNQDDSKTDALAWRAQLLAKPSDAVDILINVHGSDDDSQLTPYKQVGLVDPLTGGPCPNPGLGTGCTDFFGYADSTDFHDGQWDVPDQKASVQADGASVAIDWMTDAFTLSSISAYEHNESFINEDTDSSPLDVVHGEYVAQPSQYSQELRLTSNDAGRVRWLGGLYYFHERFEGTVHFAARGFGPGVFTGVGTTLEGAGQQATMDTDSYAAFGTVDYGFTDSTRLSVGLRFTHETKDLHYAAYITDATDVPPDWVLHVGDVPAIALFQTIELAEKKDWNDVSGRISLDHQFSDDVLGYASIARGFNSGNFNGGALFDQSEATLVDPETLLSYELGVKSQLANDRVRINAGLFYYDFTDQQVFILASGGGGTPFQQLSNAAASSLYGAEVELLAKPVRGLFLQAGAGYTHSRFDEFDSPLGGDLSGNRLPTAPKLNLNLVARYEWPALGGTLAVQGDTKYNSQQFFSVNNDPLLQQDAYWLSDARVSYTSANDRLTVSLWERNVSDENYLVAAFDVAAFGFDQWVPGDPRSYGLSVSYRAR
jgi:iron complex outermembrane recepter protein